MQLSSFSGEHYTSSLSGSSLNLFLGFYNDDGTADNTVVLSNFTFGGGASEGVTGFGTGTTYPGNLGASVTMTDSPGYGGYSYESFTAGSALSFMLTTTDNFASGPGANPDIFEATLCNAANSVCYGDGALQPLVLSLNGGAPSFSDFALFPGSAAGIPKPVVTYALAPIGTLPPGAGTELGGGGNGGTNAVPEPLSLVLLFCRAGSSHRYFEERPVMTSLVR